MDMLATLNNKTTKKISVKFKFSNKLFVRTVISLSLTSAANRRYASIYRSRTDTYRCHCVQQLSIESSSLSY